MKKGQLGKWRAWPGSNRHHPITVVGIEGPNGYMPELLLLALLHPNLPQDVQTRFNLLKPFTR